MSKKALGRGLSALIGANPNRQDPPANTEADSIRLLPLNKIYAGNLQPRKNFPAESLTELIESIKEHGIIQPLIVRENGGRFELIAGERRWRAAQAIALESVPVIVRQASDRDVLELALIENLQRENLNPIEEAQAYNRLASEFGLRQEDIAQRIGKGRATVANSLRLLALDEGVQHLLASGEITTGHAKALLGLKSQDEQRAVASDITRLGLTVRQAEKAVSSLLRPTPPPKPTTIDPSLDNALKDIQQRLRDRFSTHVSLHHQEKKGRIELEYYGNEDLHRVISLMGLTEE